MVGAGRNCPKIFFQIYKNTKFDVGSPNFGGIIDILNTLSPLLEIAVVRKLQLLAPLHPFEPTTPLTTG